MRTAIALWLLFVGIICAQVDVPRSSAVNGKIVTDTVKVPASGLPFYFPFPIKFMGVTVIPGAGIKEDIDYGLGDNLLVQADEVDLFKLKPKPSVKTPDNLRGGVRDFTPPTDRVADKITESLKREKGGENVRPILATRNQVEVARMAKATGRPIVLWSFWPDQYTGTAELFEELSEAQHILMPANHEFGEGEFLVFRHKDGGNRYIMAHKILGKECATKLRAAWEGERKPPQELGDASRLTTAERDAVQATTVKVTYPGGNVERMSIRECVARGGKMTAEVCERLGLNPDESAYAVGLTLPSAIGRYDGLGGGRESPVYRGASATAVYYPNQQGYSAPPGSIPAYGGTGHYAPVAQQPAPPVQRMPVPRQSFSGPLRGG